MKTGRKVATAEEFSVAKGENLVANATNTVAMSSPAFTASFILKDITSLVSST